MRRALLIGAIFFACASSARAATLVTSQGRPIGGVWQQWANASRMPTVPGNVVFEGPSICQGAAGCSMYYPALHTAILYASDRATLYFELGHLFDFERLTWSDRWILKRVWGVAGAPWDDTFAALQTGREDGLEADFAAAYQACALGQTLSGLSSGDAPVISMGNTCHLINLFAGLRERDRLHP